MAKGRVGKFEEADKGTLFLDEISEMPLEMQVNLLRPLEERCVVRLGDSQVRQVDVKVIVATNRNLAELVARGAFREDLYYRINVVRIDIPPLREREEDVPLLAEHHARRLCRMFRQPFSGIDAQAMAMLRAHHWPGNVRELVNCLEYAVNFMEDGVIRREHLPFLGEDPRQASSRAAFQAPFQAQAAAAFPGGQPLPPGFPVPVPGDAPAREEPNKAFTLDSVAADTIRDALAHHGGNVSHTARALGIGRNTLYAKMRKYGII